MLIVVLHWKHTKARTKYNATQCNTNYDLPEQETMTKPFFIIY